MGQIKNIKLHIVTDIKETESFTFKMVHSKVWFSHPRSYGPGSRKCRVYLMIKMFNAYIKSKIEYYSLIWNPWKKEDIDKLERIQKNYTIKIKGMENLNYHERLIKLNLYSLERRRERFMIINAWEQLEGIKENVLRLETGTIGRRRCIRSTTIPTILNGSNRTMVHYSTARQMERSFNALPYRIQKITGVTTDTFEKKLDKWLRDIPDTPKID